MAGMSRESRNVTTDKMATHQSQEGPGKDTLDPRAADKGARTNAITGDAGLSDGMTLEHFGMTPVPLENGPQLKRSDVALLSTMAPEGVTFRALDNGVAMTVHSPHDQLALKEYRFTTLTETPFPTKTLVHAFGIMKEQLFDALKDDKDGTVAEDAQGRMIEAILRLDHVVSSAVQAAEAGAALEDRITFASNVLAKKSESWLGKESVATSPERESAGGDGTVREANGSVPELGAGSMDLGRFRR